MRIALAQINATVGDIPANEARISRDIARARELGAALVVFPELALTGYPPEDLLLKEHLLEDAEAAISRLARATSGIVAMVGYPERDRDVHNAAAVLADGRLHGVYRKNRLPNYGVFDEHRYFRSGRSGAIVDIDGVTIGITICEDIWISGPPASAEASAGAQLIVNLSASPFQSGKGTERERMIGQRARDGLCAIAFCGLVGGQDELLFDGHSFVVDHEGTVLARAPQFEESLLLCDVDTQAAAAARLRDTRTRPAADGDEPAVDRLPRLASGARIADADTAPAAIAPVLDPVAEVWNALVLGTRDYAHKNGFEHAVLGLSGGIDSAVVACIAVDALGPEHVTCVTMPSRYTSEGTYGDAGLLAQGLTVPLLDIPIAQAAELYDAMLAPHFAGRDADLTEENLQSRIRGNLLMALSNKFGWLVLTTGNKSEMAVGYSTLYGDSAGGLAVIKDVPKTLVYTLAEHRNAREDRPIPHSIIDRPPSAELRPDQRDEDSLPPYEILDGILEGYVEEDLGREQLVARGFDAATVDRIIRLVDLAEYKRRQQPPGIKVTSRAFGRDRRMPITNRYGG
ncbi:unannotated protein [freshwater metagenome]|uniref:NAD(+) synthase (glutamine-hydrolyzing) n=1 Tax=freshwater metagenome TaxID=449393 RepID=A0A6J7DLQ9_9ZZZZ|nr:NAD+ synthase [Actinomycetota bacterium]